MTEKLKKIVRIIFNVALVLCAATGTIINFKFINPATILATFTTQSNLFCLIIGLVTLVRILKEDNSVGKTYIFLKGMSLTSIILTFTISNFVLKPALLPQDAILAFANNLVHVIVPLLMLAEYLVFEKKGLFKVWYPFVWPAFLFYYLGYTAVYKLFGGVYRFRDQVVKFPYFFLDYETHGWNNVVFWVSLIVLVFIVFSFIIIGLDRALVMTKTRQKV